MGFAPQPGFPIWNDCRHPSWFSDGGRVPKDATRPLTGAPAAEPWAEAHGLLYGLGMSAASAGARFRAAVKDERPLQVVGCIYAYAARMAERVGFKAIYLSGGGVAAGSLGVPDLGITTLEDVLTDVRRIAGSTRLPLLVDADTGFGGAFNIARTVRSLIASGAGAMHIEDQVQAKRCGHRPGKAIVAKTEMVDRIKAAVDARTDPAFVIMARTDALAVEGVEPAIERAAACVEAGADMVFPEAVTELAVFRRFADAVRVPILANITEFGVTPLFSVDELAGAGVGIVLYPLSAFRAMNAAALSVYETVRRDGSQKRVVSSMQTRAELYEFLDYHAYEGKLDELFSKDQKG
jgi:methylisocitrate lyase